MLTELNLGSVEHNQVTLVKEKLQWVSSFWTRSCWPGFFSWISFKLHKFSHGWEPWVSFPETYIWFPFCPMLGEKFFRGSRGSKIWREHVCKMTKKNGWLCSLLGENLSSCTQLWEHWGGSVGSESFYWGYTCYPEDPALDQNTESFVAQPQATLWNIQIRQTFGFYSRVAHSGWASLWVRQGAGLVGSLDACDTLACERFACLSVRRKHVTVTHFAGTTRKKKPKKPTFGQSPLYLKCTIFEMSHEFSKKKIPFEALNQAWETTLRYRLSKGFQSVTKHKLLLLSIPSQT